VSKVDSNRTKAVRNQASQNTGDLCSDKGNAHPSWVLLTKKNHYLYDRTDGPRKDVCQEHEIKSNVSGDFNMDDYIMGDKQKAEEQGILIPDRRKEATLAMELAESIERANAFTLIPEVLINRNDVKYDLERVKSIIGEFGI